MAVLMSLAIIPNMAKAALGDTIVLPQNSSVSVKFISTSTNYNDLVGLFSPKYIELIRAHSTPVGSQLSLGNFSAGTELIFFLDNDHGQVWFSGPASRNSDGVAHANVFSLGSNQWQMDFEDLPGGGDKDYNDVKITVTATPSCVPQAYKKCVENSVYWFDSCNTQQELHQACTQNQICQNAQCINITCSSNSQCGTNGFTGGPFCIGNSIYQNYTTYTCNNPGTANSNCTNSTAVQLINNCTANQTCSLGNCLNVTCSTNSQCGANSFIGDSYCQGNSVYRNYKTYTCNNPGAANSSCTNQTTPLLQNNCTANQICQKAQCLNIACSTNANCGTNGYIGDPYCQGNSLYRNYKTYICNNPGTINSSCTSEITSFFNACAVNQTCSNGSCLNVNITCSSNSQCGTNGFTGDPYCQGNSVYQNYKTYNCNNPGTANSSCSQSTTSQLKQDCTGNQICSNGFCTNPNIICNSNSQCGTNHFIGDLFCQGSSVYRNYITYTCNSPGTANSNCTNSTAPQLQNTCTANQTCSNGSCFTQLTQQNYTTVQTNSATNVFNNQATLNGYLSKTSTNNINYVWFQWGTTTSYGFETNRQATNYGGPFNQNIAGLFPGTVYHFRAVAQDDKGQIVYGQNTAFQLGQVLGATTVSTGLTNNFLIDSFFLPLIIALAVIWLFRSGILSFTARIDSYRVKHKDYTANKELKSKVAKIKEKENLN